LIYSQLQASFGKDAPRKLCDSSANLWLVGVLDLRAVADRFGHPLFEVALTDMSHHYVVHRFRRTDLDAAAFTVRTFICALVRLLAHWTCAALVSNGMIAFLMATRWPIFADVFFWHLLFAFFSATTCAQVFRLAAAQVVI
jgi:hypothetical protein